MRVFPTLLLAFLCLILAGGNRSQAQAAPSGDNLLQEQNWEFNRNHVAGSIQQDSVPTDQGRQLSIRKTDRVPNDHVWWRQRVAAAPGDVYHLAFEARGKGEEDHSVYVGVDFLDANGKFISFKEIKKVAYRNPKFPGTTVPDVNNWQPFAEDFTVPLDAHYFSVRLALEGGAPAEAAFRHVSVRRRSVPLPEVLGRLPPQIPVQKISLGPVESAGTRLTPNWQLAGAEVITSKARSRVCLNGLWAIQPATGNLPPKADDWAFIKVPDVLRADNPYSIYGEAKTSWKGTDLFASAMAVWFVRDVEIPAGPGPAIQLELSGLRGLAVAVYWNGRRVGNASSQLGAKLDLSPWAHPGEKGQLAIYALAQPPDTQLAYMMAAGQMAREVDATRFAQEPNRYLYIRGLSDIYLELGPAKPVFATVQAVPSTRERALELWLTGAAGGSALNYAVDVRETNGAVVWQQAKLRAEPRGTGWELKIPWPNPRLWTPDDPHLYRLTVQAADASGQVLDESLPVTFGFREIWVQGKQLMLNGHPLHLRPKLAITSYLDAPALRRQFSFLKDMGFNCLPRPWAGTTEELENYNQQSTTDYYDTADELGMLVIPYTPYALVCRGQFGTAGAGSADLDVLLPYLRQNQVELLANHPSVIAYSGFGGGYREGVNYINPRPDTWGVEPLAQGDALNRAMSSPEDRAKALPNMLRSREFVQRFKALDPSRPFLSHLDTGEGDGWGIFDYFNWTPVQEWADWPLRWSQAGIMPIGSTEHGLPYPASFLNHAIPDGTFEPWVTEYAAMVLGPQAYAHESAAYVDLLRTMYDKASGTWRAVKGPVHVNTDEAIDANLENTQGVWSYYNKAIYRAWRTYGVPMGLEPFGQLTELVDPALLKKENGKYLANPTVELRTSGAKLDHWNYFSYWPSVAMPSLPAAPTGRMPAGLTPLGQTLHEVNSPLLVYIAGAAGHPTAKDHVFTSGEKISKQIAAIWDGFTERHLELAWKAQIAGQTVGEGKLPVILSSGDIQLLPLEFAAPMVTARATGTIELTATDGPAGVVVAHDDFDFQIYPPFALPPAARNARLAIFDPAGDSVAALRKLGFQPAVLSSPQAWQTGDLLVIGRGALGALGEPDGLALRAVPASVPILVLEQDGNTLEKWGLRTYPIRTRTVFPLPAESPLLRGLGAPDLSDWRVEPRLLPAGVEPLRNGYNYHTDYAGTVASVTLETPTRGNYTPLLQNGFDLRETPLLEANFKGRRWVFCQLSVVDPLPGAAPKPGDPVGARLLANLVAELAAEPAHPLAAFGVLGGQADAELAHEVGSAAPRILTPDALGTVKVALVGQAGPHPEALKAWVEHGGTAIILPQPTEFYAACLPAVAVTPKVGWLLPVPAGAVFAGLGQGDFHYRERLPLLTFNGTGGDAADIPAGQGHWILLGFDPRRLHLPDAPWLRLSYAHQCRVLAQVLTNLGVALDLPASQSPYVGTYKHSDDPYLQHHW